MNDLSEFATKGEASIARRLVKAILAQGYAISVSDGEEYTVSKSRDYKQIIDALATTGVDYLRVRNLATGASEGVFMLLYGNAEDGSELIADYTDNAVCNALASIVDA